MGLKVIEYARLARDAAGQIIPVGLEPAVAIQEIDIDGSGDLSEPFHDATTFVLLQPDEDCYFVFGTSGELAADDGGEQGFQGVETYRGVQQGVGVRIATIIRPIPED